VTGRTLFCVLVRVVGLCLLIHVVTPLAAAVWFEGDWRHAAPVILYSLLLTAIGIACVRWPDRVARLCRWPESESAVGVALDAASWVRAGEIAVGWYAVVRLLDPLAGLVNSLKDGARGLSLWWNVFLIAFLGALAAWLLRRRTGRPLGAA
jgi:hypothetical protein